MPTYLKCRFVRNEKSWPIMEKILYPFFFGFCLLSLALLVNLWGVWNKWGHSSMSSFHTFFGSACLVKKSREIEKKVSFHACCTKPIMRPKHLYSRNYPESLCKSWSKSCDVVVSMSFNLIIFKISKLQNMLFEVILGKFLFLVCSSKVFQPNRVPPV